MTMKLLEKLDKKSYRDAYVKSNVRNGIAFQLYNMRKSIGWTQADLAKRMGTKQSAISRIEDTSYGKLSIQSLLDLASIFDVGLLVKFVSFSKLINETKDKSPEALTPDQFPGDLEMIELHNDLKEEKTYIIAKTDSSDQASQKSLWKETEIIQQSFSAQAPKQEVGWHRPFFSDNTSNR